MPETNSDEQEEIVFPNGEKITFLRFGQLSGGVPIFYLHGFPGSRLEGAIAHEYAQSMGISLIALDRPGFGGSSDTPGRRFCDFPGLLCRVADRLGLERFGVLAVSGGAPYALAAAALAPKRVLAVGIVSGMGPLGDRTCLRGMVFPNRALLNLCRYSPTTAFVTGYLIALWWRRLPSHMVLWLRLLLKGDDRRVLENPDTAKLLINNVRASLRCGVTGAAREILLLANEWGVPLEKIMAPTVFWHGDADIYVPIGLAEHTRSQIRGAELRRIQGRGHFMALELVPEVLQELVVRCKRSSER
ncbi:MAG: alpha/beta hydrolase [Proteobacteria bacterium]|nr:alpha/beta hydrolase [Pseudomonadota bacterium]